MLTKGISPGGNKGRKFEMTHTHPSVRARVEGVEVPHCHDSLVEAVVFLDKTADYGKEKNT